MINKRKIITDITIIGAAMFSMFFGAGNMIFPPYLGFCGGTAWTLGFIGYFIADIGLVIVTLLALVRVKSQKELLVPFGRLTGSALLFAIVMCLGPLISIPRTAATTYELSIVPLLGEQSLPWVYIAFFALVLIMCINKSTVVDIVGKVLTPVLFIGLFVLIVIGIINPIGDISTPPRTESIFADGIEAGYQSMDVLAAIVFGVLIINAAEKKGYSDQKKRFGVVFAAGLVAGVGLLIVYFGLAYLGATASGLHNMHILRTELLTDIVLRIFPGRSGLVFFGVIAGFACLSTAVALTGSAAEYLSEITHKKIDYKIFVIAVCAFSAVVSVLGVDRLVALATPILSVVYPPVLVAVVLSYVGKSAGKWTYRLTGYTAMLFGLYDAVSSFGLRIGFIDSLPLSRIGLSWLLPTIAAFFVGFSVDRIIKHKSLI